MTKAFSKSEKQKLAVKLQGQYMHSMLDGGSRSGKTFITLRSVINRACAKKSRHVVLRLRFNAVKTAIVMDTLPKVWELCFPNLPPLSQCLNRSDWFVQLPNGSQIWFAGLDDKERTEKILGTEYSTLYFNESSQFPWESVNMALTRLAENSGLTLKAFYDCNPPTKKHWIYKVFYEGVDPDTNDEIEDWEEDYGVMKINPVDNEENLPIEYFKMLRRLPKKQRERFLLGLYGSDIAGALWNQEMMDAAHSLDEPWKLIRTVVGVDPATTSDENSDEWGIGVAELYSNGQGKVTKDRTEVLSPTAAAQVIINTYDEVNADAVVVETNQGGDMITSILRLKGFKGRVIQVHATKGKFSRAEPVTALYEQNLIKHVQQGLEKLETEMTEWVPYKTKKSPNRIDWLVYALTELFGIGQPNAIGVL